MISSPERRQFAPIFGDDAQSSSRFAELHVVWAVSAFVARINPDLEARFATAP
jgi:hypothetical protein